jgi:hypothetical protein
MKIDFSQQVTVIGGEKLRMGKPDAEPDTLGQICSFVLDQAQLSQQPNPEESYSRYKLAKLIALGGEIDLSAEQVVLLRRCAGATLRPLAFGAISDIIDPPPA